MIDLRSEFAVLAEMPAEQREARLNGLSSSDPDGVTLLRRLLEADGLPKSLTLGVSQDRMMGVREGNRVGDFMLERRLGEGATSVVFEARQFGRVERVAALKILRPMHTSAAVARRFEIEKRALSSMQHPNVATIYDAGATDEGLLYIAMEFVSGERITGYCVRTRPSLRDRLGLMIQLCDGVQHAHTKALLHRDLKPANVLVTDVGGSATVKVIDFGIAKALADDPAADHALSTAALGIVGTPAYMAPEQAGVGGQDIDARADVYSLGVILYEMLTGERPIDDASLSTTDLATLQRVLSMQEPVKPSERSRAQPDQDVAIESRRLRGELDWIVMKCLEKDRERRYGTPAALAEDLRRFMQDAPVTAGPPGRAYRIRKFVKRNRAGVAAAAAVSLVLVAATAVSSALAVSESRQRHIANQAVIAQQEALEESIKARKDAESARTLEQSRAAELERVTRFQASRLAELDPATIGVALRTSLLSETAAFPSSRNDIYDALDFTGIAQTILNDHLIEPTLSAIDREFHEQDTIRAMLLQTIAMTMGEIGLLERAAEVQRGVVDLYRKMHGEHHHSTIEAENNLVASLGVFGATAEALRLGEEVRDRAIEALGTEHPLTLDVLNSLGVAMLRDGKLKHADALLRQTLAVKERTLGDMHPSTIVTLRNLAQVVRRQGMSSEAEPVYREVLRRCLETYGPESRETYAAYQGMSAVLNAMGRPAEAEPFSRASWEGYRRLYGEAHHSTLHSARNVAVDLSDMGRLEEALKIHREVYEIRLRTLGRRHVHTLQSMSSLGRTLVAMGRPEEGIVYSEQALHVAIDSLGCAHPQTLELLMNTGAALRKLGRELEAAGMYEDSMSEGLGSHGPQHFSVTSTIIPLRKSLVATGQYAKYERVLDNLTLAYSQLPDFAERRLPVLARQYHELYKAWEAARPDDAIRAKRIAWEWYLDDTTSDRQASPEMKDSR